MSSTVFTVLLLPHSSPAHYLLPNFFKQKIMVFRMYRNDSRIALDKKGSLTDADEKIKTLITTLHLTICKINRIHKGIGKIPLYVSVPPCDVKFVTHTPYS